MSSPKNIPESGANPDPKKARTFQDMPEALHAASSGPTEEELIAEQEADRKLMDDLMPDMNGFDPVAETPPAIDLAAVQNECAEISVRIQNNEKLLAESRKILSDLKNRNAELQDGLKNVEQTYTARSRSLTVAFGRALFPVIEESENSAQGFTAEDRSLPKVEKMLASANLTMKKLRSTLEKMGIGKEDTIAAATTADKKTEPVTDTESATITQEAEPQTPEEWQQKRDALKLRDTKMTTELRQTNGERVVLEKQVSAAKTALENRERYLQEQEPYAIQKLASEVLPIIDTAERSLSLIKADERATNPALEKMAQHFEQALSGISAVFNQNSVKVMEPLGQPYDETKHQALGVKESEGAEPGTVIEVALKGYMLKDRVLRSAQVFVSPE
jgi:molecular chaperone GrpE